MKFTDKCISITDLRMKTKECIANLEQGERYIFVNNKPKAVLVDIAIYEQMKSPIEIGEISKEELSPSLKKKINNAKELPKTAFINI